MTAPTLARPDDYHLARPTPPSGYYQVSIERGRYRTATGERVRYDLFIPQPDPALPSPPWPVVVLNHGFARGRTRQRNNALHLAERGVVVLTPDMGCLLGGERAQLQNISDLVGEVAWLAERSVPPGDVLLEASGAGWEARDFACPSDQGRIREG